MDKEGGCPYHTGVERTNPKPERNPKMKTLKNAADLRKAAEAHREEAARCDREAQAATNAGNQSKAKAWDDAAEGQRVRARVCLRKAEALED